MITFMRSLSSSSQTTVIDEQEEKHRTCVCFEENVWEKTDTSTCLQCAQFVDVCGVLGRDPSKVSYLTSLSPSVLLPSSWVSPLLGYSASSKAPEALKIYPRRSCWFRQMPKFQFLSCEFSHMEKATDLEKDGGGREVPGSWWRGAIIL